jgi:hypothetical protein
VRCQTRHALLLALAFGVLGTTAAFAAELPPSPNPLPGSQFQGADGNQDDAPPLIDWQAMQAAGRVVHNPDENEQDTAFTGGSKEDEPGSWDFRVEPDGVSPPKANILDAWSAVDRGGADAFVYLGFARGGPGITRIGGTTFLTFELNHDSRLWNNGHATIPCRRTGDVLVSYQAQGNDVDVVLERWVTSQTDLATGCATHGHLEVLSGLTPNVDAQGAVNGPTITSYLPGFYDGSIPIERFGEAALNLSRILDDALGDECFSFGSIWMHSRSSTEGSSNMQDYVAPQELAVRTCAASGTKFHDLNANGSRDRGEPGLPRWVIWADYDNDGVHDATEPFGITDDEGQYVVNDIRPPRGRYMLRETLLTSSARRRAAAARVTCSYPNASTQGGTGSAPGGMFHCGWGPITVTTETWARRRDFGNYAPATIVVKKELEPTTDPGRFDLLVNSVIVVPAAGHGAMGGRSVRPGRHTVSEAAVTGTNPLDYRSTVGCEVGTRRRQVRSGSVYGNLLLSSGQRAVCTFRNVRIGVPSPQPPAPPPPPQPPAPPSPLVPPGPKPPDAGDAATAGILFRQATKGCIRGRVPRLSFQGTRIARIQVFVNGNLRRRLTVQTLQRRVTPRVTLSPGSYRLAVRVTFQRGTGSPPVTFRRRIRICAVKAARPPFTG